MFPNNKLIFFYIVYLTTLFQRGLGDDDGSEVDLLIYYTKRGACQWINEDYPCTLDTVATILLQTYAEEWEQQYCNDVLTQSLIDFTFVTVHVAIDPSYDEGKDPDDDGDVLDHLTDINDGFLENAHSLRGQYYADLVWFHIERIRRERSRLGT